MKTSPFFHRFDCLMVKQENLILKFSNTIKTMKKAYFLLLTFQVICLLANGQVSVKNLLTENLTNPIGLDVAEPRFTWQLASEKRGIYQSAYEIKVMLGKVVVWNSGKVSAAESVQIPYAGDPLQSGKKYTWQVRVWDKNGKGSPWSQPASFQMAFLKASDWKAKWIEPDHGEEPASRPSPLLRKQFSLGKKVISATAYITAHGMYEAQLNGTRIGDAYLTPGWTAYKKRLQYQVYDVTHLLRNGSNALGITLGNGWYRGI